MYQRLTAGLSRLNDYTHVVAVSEIKSNQPIYASNQIGVFEINPGHFKRPFQEPRDGTDISLALPDQYLMTFLRSMPSIKSAKRTFCAWCNFDNFD